MCHGRFRLSIRITIIILLDGEKFCSKITIFAIKRGTNSFSHLLLKTVILCDKMFLLVKKNVIKSTL